MSLVDTFNDLVGQPEQATRAVFEAAMIDRINTTGYTMSDLMWDLFQAQHDVSILSKRMQELSLELIQLRAKITKKKAG